MTNGFYETEDWTYETKKRFLLEAISLSYKAECQVKYRNGNNYREVDKTTSMIQQITTGLNDKSARIEVIDRFAHNGGVISKDRCEYEICLHWDWNFLYIFTNEENFFALVKMYDIKLIEW